MVKSTEAPSPWTEASYWPPWIGPRPAPWVVVSLVAVSALLTTVVALSVLYRTPRQRAEQAVHRALIAVNTARPDDAESELASAIRLDPRNKSALFNYAILQQRSGQFDSAEELYRRALRVDRRLRPAILNLAVIIADDRPREALALFRRLTNLSPSDPRARFNLGYVLLKMGNENEGLRHLDRAVRMDSTFKERRDRALAVVRARGGADSSSESAAE